MKRVIVRYKVKRERVEENEKLVNDVYRELHAEKPADFRYATFKLADGVNFIHIAMIDGDRNPLSTLPAFKAFSATIADRCDEPPAPADMIEIGSYGFSGS